MCIRDLRGKKSGRNMISRQMLKLFHVDEMYPDELYTVSLLEIWF